MDTHELLFGKKRVLVTGAGTGIGRGVALRFARAGADVALHYSHSGEGAEAAAEQARAWGVQAEAMQADFENVSAVTALAGRAAAPDSSGAGAGRVGVVWGGWAAGSGSAPGRGATRAGRGAGGAAPPPPARRVGNFSGFFSCKRSTFLI